MSDSALANPAPTDENPAPVADAPGSEVAEESVTETAPPDVVSADRFNGLMSTFNKTQDELKTARERAAELEARLAAIEAPEGNRTTVSEAPELEARIDALTSMLLEERMETARQAAIRDYPEAAPLADLIVGNTPEDIREMARTIASRMPKATPEADSSTGEADTEPTEDAPEGVDEPEVPVLGGGAAYSGEPNIDERVAEAIQKRSFSDLIAAKWDSLSTKVS